MLGPVDMNQAKVLLALPKTLALSNGTRVDVRPFRFRELAQVTLLALPIIDDMIVKPSLDEAASGGQGAAAFDSDQFFMDVLQRHTASVEGLIALSTGLPAAVIEQLGALDGIDLVAALFEVNADFFTKALPMITRLSVSKARGLSSSSAPPPSPGPMPPAAPGSAPGFDSPTP